jgi:sterol desaturase/sphingolipid hydroxylase (fatty acid hydroxylase superfamily)
VAVLPYLGLVGVDTWMHEAARYQAWVHTEMIGPMRWVDRFFNTPANHRVHHDAELSRGVNLGGITIVWDRLFGTYVPARAVVRYGIGERQSPTSVLAVYSQPFRR